MSEMNYTINVLDVAAPKTTILGKAIRALMDKGHDVSLTGDIPGLFTIDGGPELTTSQLISLSGITHHPGV
jgi:hypothetical protein